MARLTCWTIPIPCFLSTQPQAPPLTPAGTRLHILPQGRAGAIQAHQAASPWLTARPSEPSHSSLSRGHTRQHGPSRTAAGPPGPRPCTAPQVSPGDTSRSAGREAHTARGTSNQRGSGKEVPDLRLHHQRGRGFQQEEGRGAWWREGYSDSSPCTPLSRATAGSRGQGLGVRAQGHQQQAVL